MSASEHPRPLQWRVADLVHRIDGTVVYGPHAALSGDWSSLTGDCTALRGDCSGLSGDCSGLRGDCTGLIGECTEISGNLDEIPLAERPSHAILAEWVKLTT